MLWNAARVRGFAVEATDGRVGVVDDFLFDDVSWRVRWVVVEAGPWPSKRKVLLQPAVLGRIDRPDREISVALTKRKVMESPDAATERSVSRQMETEVCDHYGWTPYWRDAVFEDGYGYVGGATAPSILLASDGRREARADRERDEDDPHLRGMTAVTGYHVHAADGVIGHVEDFLIGDSDWRVHFLLVDTGTWLPGKKVLISPSIAQEIDWSARTVRLAADRQTVKDGPPYDAATTLDANSERGIHDHYGDGDVGAAAPAYPSGDAGNFG